MAIPTKFSGGCACGAIRYECSARPAAMVNCHCRDCQRAGGSASSPTVVVPSATVRLSGEPTHYDMTAESGAIARRAFCPTCGSALYATTSARPDVMAIRAGSLDDPSWFHPAADVWTASAQPWDVMDRGVPKFPKQRRAAPAPQNG